MNEGNRKMLAVVAIALGVGLLFGFFLERACGQGERIH